jgi:hypothetical protein
MQIMISWTRLLAGCFVFALLAPISISMGAASDHNDDIGTFSVTTSNGTAVLEWRPLSPQQSLNEAVKYYRIHRSMTADLSDARVIATIPAEQTTYTDETPPYGVVCWYQIEVVVGNDSTYSMPGVVGIGRTVPLAPVQLTCLAGDGSVWVSWVSGPSQMGTTTSSSFILLGGNWSANLTKIGEVDAWSDQVFADHTYNFRMDGLQNGAPYWIGVAAVNSMGQGAVAGPVEVMPISGPWNLTTNIIHTDTADPVPVNISWSSPNMTDGLSHYIVWSSKTGDHLVEGNVSYFNETVSCAWSNQYRVAAVYQDGSRTYSDYINVQGPMVEGDPNAGRDSFMLLTGTVLLVLAVAGAILILNRRRKRRL